jgi:hypothetical protein
VTFIAETFPLFTEDDISKVLQYYPGLNSSDSASAPDFATLGYSGPTAVNESSIATGQQQRANVIYILLFSFFRLLSENLEEDKANKNRISTRKQHLSVLRTGLQKHIRIKAELALNTNTLFLPLYMEAMYQDTSVLLLLARDQTLRKPS